MFNRSKLALAGVLASLFPGIAAAQTAISPHLVGQNLWYKDLSPDVWSKTQQAGVALVRIGGHAYDTNMPDDATLVRWVKQIRAIGAEPMLQVSQYKGPEAAAKLVRLFNVDRAAGEPIKFWSIGNEPWLQNKKPDFALLAPMVVKYTRPIAAAMKEVDPTIKTFGFDECDLFQVPYDALFGGEHDVAGKVPGKEYHYLDGLTWHRYPQNDAEPGRGSMREFEDRSRRAREVIDRANAKLGRTGDDALTWAVTEFNAKNGPFVHTFGNGQLFAGVYKYAMKYGAFTAATWSMFEHAGDRKGTDYSFLDGADKTPRASYWHMKLVGDHFEGTYVDAATSDDAIVAFGAQSKDGLSVMILNTGDRPTEYRLAASSASGATSMPAPTISLALDGPLLRDLAGTIPARATRVLLIRAGEVTQIDYSAEDFAAQRPPSSTRQKD